jgi:hypothetical protein
MMIFFIGHQRCGLALICAPAGQGVAGVERIAARQHHDGNPVRLLWGCG